MRASDITAEIEAVLGTTKTNYRGWTIGITNDLERRKGEHTDQGHAVAAWRSWQADSEPIAKSVLDSFQRKGMDGDDGGGDGRSVFVYIF